MEEKGKKRGRKIDYTPAEKSKLIEMFVENNDIITGKLDSSLRYKDKNEVFIAICEAVNAIGGNNRTVEIVKNCWQTIKKSVKSKAGKLFSKEKKSVKKTGGGEAEVNTKIEDILTEEEMNVVTCKLN